MMSKMGLEVLRLGGTARQRLHDAGLQKLGAGRQGLQMRTRFFHKETAKGIVTAHQIATEDVDPDLPRFVDMRQGKKAKQTFSAAEMNRRLNMLRGYMAGQGIGACVFTSFHGIKYFSDFLYCAFGRPYALVVTMDDAVTVSAAIDGGQPWRRTFAVDAGQPWRKSVAENLTYTDWQRDNYFRAVKLLVEAAQGSTIGFEYDHIPVDSLNKMQAFMPAHKPVDISRAATRMRMFKSPEELEIIRAGAAVADLGGAAVVEALGEGVPEWIVARHATTTMIDAITAKYPDAEVMDTWTWVQSGINTDGAHNPLTTRKINSGDILSLNCFPMISGYYTALERTLFLNHCSDAHLKYWEANVAVHRRGLELMKPGTRCCDIANELNELCKSMGLLKYRSFGYGHSFGVICHYYGREAELELREDIDTVLQPGMVVSMEPMFMIPEGVDGSGGYREHDILIITDDGAENITNFPFGPEHNIIKK